MQDPVSINENMLTPEPLALEGAIMELDYLIINGAAKIRIIVKCKDGTSKEIFDSTFKPYFYLIPNKDTQISILNETELYDNGRKISSTKIEATKKELFGKTVDVYKIYVQLPSDVPKLAAAMSKYGRRFEYDIPFARRYALDKNIIPFNLYLFKILKENNRLELKEFEEMHVPLEPQLNILFFDIETYNPLGVPRPEKDPVIMISYSIKSRKKNESRVITSKKIELPFVDYVTDERAMFEHFVDIIKENDIDIITGYNSANFDIRYMLERAQALKINFNLARGSGDTRIERHGLVDKVKIGGRVHVDMYLVVKFISVVGAAENLLKLNSYTLKNVYEAIAGSEKVTVEKLDIFKLWDGNESELKLLAKYNLADSHALETVYNKFIPIMIELSRTTGNVLSDTAVSTTGQLVEYMLMRYALMFNEIVPNKPKDEEIRARMLNPIEGAYVKTPDPGVYEKLAIFDFRGLYPSIIIAHNIDPSSICEDCTDYHLSPINTKFSKTKKVVTPIILKQLIEQRSTVKKEYKKNPENIFLGSRSQALKIVSNSFFGYLGYPRSRWYSRECAGSVTAYGRQYIKDTIIKADNYGFKVIYSDTDSIVILLNDKSEEDALQFMKEFNKNLPEGMELELEDFYVRGLFVGKKTATGSAGAKKKYAMITKNNKIKIRGFELVRRDWSKIARDTQRRVLETILKEGSPQRAAQIVKDTIMLLKEGAVPLDQLTINTQLRKKIDDYDSKSPELGAVKKAVDMGLKKKSDMESAVISYVIGKSGNTISDKAVLLEFAKDYDVDYYVNHQVMPAVMRILKELNFEEDELKLSGTQKKL